MGFPSFKNKITGFSFFKVKYLISKVSCFNREHEIMFQKSGRIKSIVSIDIFYIKKQAIIYVYNVSYVIPVI